MRQAAALARALAATAGEAAVRRALPSYAALAVACGLLFGGNGLEPATVVAGAADSPLVRVLLWSAWLLLSASALDALWRAPTSFWLRSLPVPRAWHLAVLLAFSLLAELPWFVLWQRGGGLLAGLAALGGALALHALALARPPGLAGLVPLALGFTLVLLAPPAALVDPPRAPPAAAPAWPIGQLLLSLGTWPVALLALRRAWLAAPARSGHTPRAFVRGPAVLALALAHLAGLARAHLPVLLRAALLAGLAAAAAWLAARNNALTRLDDRLTHALGFLALPALLAGSAASAPLLACESRGAWLLVAAGARARLAAHALAVTLLGLAVVAPAGLALARAWQLAPGEALRLLAHLALAAAALATLAALIARWAARFGARAPGRQLLATLLAAVLALVLLAQLGPRVALAWSAVTLTAWLIGHVLSTSPVHPAGGDPVLTMTAVRKRLGTRLVLADVDLACPPGAVTLVLGENGAGKSTLLRIAAGILEPDAGSVTVAGHLLTAATPSPPRSAPPLDAPRPPDLAATPSPPRTPLAAPPPASPRSPDLAALPPALAARRALGYAPDTADAFPDLAVRELLALVTAMKRAPLPPEALRDRLGLAPIWHQRLRTLSFGQVKRTYLFAALVGDPALLVLDEPSNGLDPDGARTVADLLRERAAAGHAALVSTNDAAFAARLDGVALRLHAGRLAREAAPDLRAQSSASAP